MPDRHGEAQERTDNRTRRVVNRLLAAGGIVLVIAVAAATLTGWQISEDADSVEHALAVESTLGQLSAQTERIETARRGYIIQPDAGFAAIARKASTDFDALQAALEALVTDSPIQSARARNLGVLGRQKDAIVAEMLTTANPLAGSRSSQNFGLENGVVVTRQMRGLLDTMLRAERALLVQRSRGQFDTLVRFYAIGGFALALLVALMVAAIVLVLRYNRDLASGQVRLRRANEGLEAAVSARTTELSRANEEIQRFAYIVSHDLRSPLVNVLGFTAELDEARKTLHRHLATLYEDQPELRDEAAWLAVDEDLPEALGFIRNSTEKMDRLINSILELSRQGRRPLHPERLDMTALAEGVTATMHQRAEAAGASVTVSPVPDLESDRIAIEQIVSNLVENALKYLNAARAGEVRIAGERKGNLVEISVTDNGRGIAPADHERIFELFRRAGVQDQAGEGIGLANVRALAYRLGGRISVESQLNEGSRFMLILPEKFVVEVA